MQDLISRRVAAFFKAEKISPESFKGKEVEPGKVDRFWKSGKSHLAKEAYKNLGGLYVESVVTIKAATYPLVLDQKVIVGLDELAYHRYAAICFRSAFYEGIEGLKTEAHLRHCRQFEANCKKPGLIAGVWTNPEAERHFGAPSAPGDFYGNGSPGWKLLAFRSLLRDMLARFEGYEVLHFSIYDQIMSDGKLLTIGELLKSPSGTHYIAFEKYLRRRLGLPAVATE